MDGSPADAVRWALDQFYGNTQKLNLIVISGSNRGQNYGLNWVASGTVGAAGTAAMLGIARSIAVSQGLTITGPGGVMIGLDIAEYLLGAQFIANLVQALVDDDPSVGPFNKLGRRQRTVLNVNIPVGPVAGLRVSRRIAACPTKTESTALTLSGTVTPHEIGFDLDNVESLGIVPLRFPASTAVGALARGPISVQPLVIQRAVRGVGRIDDSLPAGVVVP